MKNEEPGDGKGLNALLEGTCPACGAPLVQQQCKVFCSRCHRLVFNCSEF